MICVIVLFASKDTSSISSTTGHIKMPYCALGSVVYDDMCLKLMGVTSGFSNLTMRLLAYVFVDNLSLGIIGAERQYMLAIRLYGLVW